MELCISYEQQAKFLSEQTECPKCQGTLDNFIEYLEPGKLKEEARCTQCNALSYTNTATIQ